MGEIKKITIIGSGIMGAGIAQSIFKYGLDVTLYDQNREELEKACQNIKSKARRKMDPDKVHMAITMEEALKDCDLVIEAIYEDLQVKCELFKEMGQLADKNTIFATNTSSLSVSTIAEASGRPDRFLGLHFFNPAIIMRLVEMIIHEGLDKDVLLSVKDFIKVIKKQPVLCKESPGFIVNRILLPVINEAFYLLEERVGKGDKIETANQIDTAILADEILLMGPFNLADLTGIDTIQHVSNIIYEGFNRSPRYKMSPLIEKLYNAGHYGRKCGRGIYYYGNNTNDPDINPALDSKGEKIPPAESPDFDTLDLVSVIVNEAFRVIEEGIVEDYNDIELSMELGTRWPRGPFRMAKETGLDIINARLSDLYKNSGNNPRYEPSGIFTDMTEDLKQFFKS